jgi:hypothetical protein
MAGATWQHVQVVVDNPLMQGNPDPARQPLLQGNVAADALAVDPQNPAAVYFAGKGANAEGLYRSADGGKTWSARPFLDLYPADAGATQTGFFRPAVRHATSTRGPLGSAGCVLTPLPQTIGI